VKKNKGFSLVEMMVTVAILGILVAVITPSLYTLFSSSTRGCATNLDSLLGKCQVYAMGRSENVVVMIYKADDGKIWGEYIEGTTHIGQPEQLGDSRVALTATPPGGSAYTPTKAQPLYISFHCATGGLSLFGSDRDGVFTPSAGQLARIDITSAGKPYEVLIYATTGKHEVNSL